MAVTGMTLLFVLAAFLLRTARVLEALLRGSRIEWAGLLVWSGNM